jgi:hypothetical protein
MHLPERTGARFSHVGTQQCKKIASPFPKGRGLRRGIASEL